MGAKNKKTNNHKLSTYTNYKYDKMTNSSRHQQHNNTKPITSVSAQIPQALQTTVHLNNGSI